MADEVAVMYAGRVVERGDAAELFDDPQHPYTIGLLGSIPRLSEERDRLLSIERSVPPPSSRLYESAERYRCTCAGVL